MAEATSPLPYSGCRKFLTSTAGQRPRYNIYIQDTRYLVSDTRYTFWGWEEIWDTGRKIEIIKVSDHDDAAPDMEMETERTWCHFFTI